MTHARSLREISRDGSILDENAGSVLSKNQQLGHTLGNRTHAATILGISIRALRNKLRDYAQAGVTVPPPAGSPA